MFADVAIQNDVLRLNEEWVGETLLLNAKQTHRTGPHEDLVSTRQ